MIDLLFINEYSRLLSKLVSLSFTGTKSAEKKIFKMYSYVLINKINHLPKDTTDRTIISISMSVNKKIYKIFIFGV